MGYRWSEVKDESDIINQMSSGIGCLYFVSETTSGESMNDKNF